MESMFPKNVGSAVADPTFSVDELRVSWRADPTHGLMDNMFWREVNAQYDPRKPVLLVATVGLRPFGAVRRPDGRRVSFEPFGYRAKSVVVVRLDDDHTPIGLFLFLGTTVNRDDVPALKRALLVASAYEAAGG